MSTWLGLDARAARVSLTVLVFAAGLAVLYLLRHILLLLAFSVFFAYLLYPLVRLVQRVRPLAGHRTVAIGIVYGLLLIAVSVVGATTGPKLTTELSNLASRLPEISEQMKTGTIAADMLEAQGVNAAHVRDVEIFLREHAGGILAYVQGVATAVAVWLAGGWTLMLIPIFAFFVLKDAEAITTAVTGLIETPRHRDLWGGIGQDVHVLLGQYVRALVLLALLTFLVWTSVFLVAGVPYAVVLAALAGVLEFLPFFGPLVAGTLVMIVAIFSGYAHPVLLLVFIIVWRGIQDYVSSPLIMGRGIELHPGLVIFGVIAGGEVAGAPGMFLSIPVISALRIVWRRLQVVPRLRIEPAVARRADVAAPPAEAPLRER
ncbi:MAG TPA: AI-2E family transporter [Candidatus Limnocylindria bacterium]|nr:AI-2E family transporter [Candidatus Limnocylindria bacterium]